MKPLPSEKMVKVLDKDVLQTGAPGMILAQIQSKLVDMKVCKEIT
jgi:hypothetical protein